MAPYPVPPCHVQSHDPKFDYLVSRLSCDVKTNILLPLNPLFAEVWDFSEEQGDQIKEESFIVNRSEQQNSLYTSPSLALSPCFFPFNFYFFQPDKVRG